MEKSWENKTTRPISILQEFQNFKIIIGSFRKMNKRLGIIYNKDYMECINRILWNFNQVKIRENILDLECININQTLG